MGDSSGDTTPRVRAFSTFDHNILDATVNLDARGNRMASPFSGLEPDEGRGFCELECNEFYRGIGRT